MLGRLARWLWALIVGGDDRAIFRFHDGRRWRAVDPLVVYRALDAHPTFNWSSDPLLIERDDDEALQRCVTAVRDAFGLPLFDGKHGLTESECYALLQDFTGYVGYVKKKRDTLPTSPEPTASEPLAASTTSPDLDCGCGSGESTDATPPP